ncbi:uncharacterized protein ATC70_005381 [Mucor velutinosus]|uniref:TPR-like protein n=1 Tax=Mucor velutinosus TaxID=708070 RepID=A0AAN7HYF8_9FUNG|nr:hypothetical protein ATC70_005381 [Mucor velutinosus]
MVTNKAITISKEIDVARCKGHWQAIPELARRYRKHNPNGLALEQSILAEANLVHVLESNRKDSKKLFAKDSPNNITLSTRVSQSLIKPIQQQLSTALGDKDPSAETQLVKEMTRMILARSWFECGEYQKALEAISETGYAKLKTTSGYSYTLYMQTLAIRAMSLDLLQQNAMMAYDELSSAVNQAPSLIDHVVVDWAEEGLYRGTLLALSDSCQSSDRIPQTMNLIRAYQKACASQLNTWRVYKRVVVTRYSLSYFSSLYRAHQYAPPVDFSETEEGKQCSEDQFMEAKREYDHQLFSIEIMQLHTIYEKLVYSLAHFPRSGQPNALVLDFVNRLAEDFELVGGTETEKRGYVEALNRASLKTFNSPCITRHLFHALVQLGDYEEAEHALGAYLYLVDLESKAMVESRSMTAALASDSFGYSTPVPSADQVEELAIAEKTKKSDGPQRSEEVETLDNKIKLLMAAVKMYCQELCKGSDAVNMAEMAERIYAKEMANSDQHDDHFIEMGAVVYRTLGVAFGFLASQTFDQDRRPKYHENALVSLRKSMAINNQSWETYYQLALQLADMRDIVQALQMITQSLQLNSQHLPSWHLLALLCTCPIKDSQAQALKTCEIALMEASKITSKDSWVDYSDDILQHVLLQMTQTLLIERVQGAEAAMASQEALFQVFGKIVVPELIPDATSSNMLHEAISNGNARYGMVLSGSLGNMSMQESVNGSANAASVTRNRSASNASMPSRSLGGRSASVSSFTGRKFHLADMFSHGHLEKSDVSSVRSVPAPVTTTKGAGEQSLHRHASKLSLLDPKSLIRKQKKEEMTGNTTRGSPTALDGGSASSIHSIASSIISTHTLLQTTTALSRPTTHARLQHQRSCKMLCDLWLLSAEGFLRTGKLEEALKAVSEAENVDWTTHAGVWCLLGRIRLAQNKPDRAISAFQKGLVTKPNDVDCRIWLARTYIEQGHLEVAEGLLLAITQENGWDHASAWYYLGEIYKKTDRLDRTKDCLFYALELESTTPIQPFTILPRFV